MSPPRMCAKTCMCTDGVVSCLFLPLRTLETTTILRILKTEFTKHTMPEVLSLTDVKRIPFIVRLQDLFFVFGDGVVDRAARCLGAEVNECLTHAWYAAHRWGLPMQPEMKQKLLKEFISTTNRNRVSTLL